MTIDDIQEGLWAPGEFNAVLYTDGGSNQDTLLSGWSIHGYVYPLVEEKKNEFTKAKGVPSNYGYVDGRTTTPSRNLGTDRTYKGSKGTPLFPYPVNPDAAPVVPMHYLDFYGGQHATTNNYAEMTGLMVALQFIEKFQPKQAFILPDSEYALKGLLVWRQGWERNGGKNSKGIITPNWEYWKQIYELYDRVVATNHTELFFTHVYGHSGDAGNEKADYNANCAMILQRDVPGTAKFLVSDAKGYIQKTKISNRLLEQRWWYATNDRASNKYDFDERHFYFFGNHGKAEDEEDLIGKSTATAKVSILLMKEPEPVLELLGEFLKNQFYDGSNVMTLGYLENILQPERYANLLTHGQAVLWDDKSRDLLSTPDKVPVLKELRPTYLGYTLLDKFDGLVGVLEKYLKGNSSVVVTDITDKCLVTTQEGNKKPVTKPTDAINPPHKAFTVELNYLMGGKEGKTKVKLKLGQDIPLRNTLNAIGTSETKVYAITWPVAPTAFRYGTIVEENGELLFSCSLSSNLYELTGKL
ncbi:RnhA [Serratia phage BUCT660]|nr:RnhA [Serratia phage BUCT660]